MVNLTIRPYFGGYVNDNYVQLFAATGMGRTRLPAGAQQPGSHVRQPAAAGRQGAAARCLLCPLANRN
jgi:hypothetical protein